LTKAYGQFPPTTVFFAIFGATMAVALGVILPLGYYLSCMLYGRQSEPSPADSEFGRKLVFKYRRQVARVAVIAGIGCFLLSLWPVAPSNQTAAGIVPSRPVSFWQRSGLPLVAILIQVATLRYYYRKGGELETTQTLSTSKPAP
jgi:hypothetical protein